MDNNHNIYSVDTGILIDMHRVYFPSVFKTLWIQFEALASEGRVIAPQLVKEELKHKDDEVYQWAQLHSYMFKRDTQDSIDCVGKLAKRFQKYAHALSLTGAEHDAADPYVIALALAANKTSSDQRCVVLTTERIKGNREKVPFVCHEVGLRCFDMNDFFTAEKWEF